jgi:hypothetical protein
MQDLAVFILEDKPLYTFIRTLDVLQSGSALDGQGNK